MRTSARIPRLLRRFHPYYLQVSGQIPEQFSNIAELEAEL
jgi:hypothetical protein